MKRLLVLLGGIIGVLLAYRVQDQESMALSEEELNSLLQLQAAAGPPKPLFNLEKKLTKPAAISFENPSGRFEMGILNTNNFEI